MAGPEVLVVGFVVALSPDLVEELGVPAPPGWPACLLLGLDPVSSTPWSRAGDASTGMGLLAGFPEESLSVSSRMPFVARGWPHAWSEGRVPAMRPERIPRPVELLR